MTFPGGAWRSLNLIDVGDLFQARVVLRSGAVPVRYSFDGADLQWHQIILYREATGKRFGESPVVGVKVVVAHYGETLYETKYEHLTWYDAIPTPDKACSRIPNNSMDAGYQYFLLACQD